MTVLEKHYGCRIPEEETGYFAMLFVYALEQKYNEPEKVRILIVCGAGRASSGLLKYKYEKEFGEYLKKVYVCGLHELAGFDFDKVEYVFINSSNLDKGPEADRRGRAVSRDGGYRKGAECPAPGANGFP